MSGLGIPGRIFWGAIKRLLPPFFYPRKFMKSRISPKKFDELFTRISKKKGKTIGNPPKVQQMPYQPRKETKT